MGRKRFRLPRGPESRLPTQLPSLFPLSEPPASGAGRGRCSWPWGPAVSTWVVLRDADEGPWSRDGERSQSLDKQQRCGVQVPPAPAVGTRCISVQGPAL